MKKGLRILGLVLALCMMVSAVPAKALTPPITVYFDSLDEVRRFFDLDEGLMVNGELKTVADYFPNTQMKRISATVDTLMFPYLEIDGKPAKLDASWVPDNRTLDVIYVVDEIQYRFTYFFLSEKDWSYDDGTEKGIRVGPYQLNFRRTDHPIFEYFYVSGFREDTSYVQISAKSDREDCLTFDRFSFIHLSELKEETQPEESSKTGWIIVAGSAATAAVLAGIVIWSVAKRRKAKVRKEESILDE